MHSPCPSILEPSPALNIKFLESQESIFLSYFAKMKEGIMVSGTCCVADSYSDSGSCNMRMSL